MKTFRPYLLILFLAACSRQQNHPLQGEHEHAIQKEAIKYTCPMHPQIVQDVPGSCPICGMDLVPVTKGNEVSPDLMLTDSQIKLANITTQRVTKKPVGQTVAINGRLAADERKTEAISSRASGRIEKLFVKETGQNIRRGQPLYTLYSENLLTLQQEYLLAKEQYESLGERETRYKSFLDAAEKKLLLYGLTQGQVDRLSRNTLEPRITFVAPASGIVTEINGVEGQYIAEGTPLYRIEDMTSLWVEAELYADESSLVKIGDRIEIRVSGAKDPSVQASVSFLSPEFRNNTQITIMRSAISNPGGDLKPGQHVQVLLTHSSREAIAIPVNAVIRDSQGSHVYIQSGNNTFRPQRVETGIETFEQIEITEGLHEGDTLAATGAYLLYSEIILKKGTDPMKLKITNRK